MDGARFANAVVSLGCSPADITWRAVVYCRLERPKMVLWQLKPFSNQSQRKLAIVASAAVIYSQRCGFVGAAGSL